MPRGEEFRKQAQKCHRLSTLLEHPAHSSFALDLEKAWIELAEYEERKAAAVLRTMAIFWADLTEQAGRRATVNEESQGSLTNQGGPRKLT